MEERSGVFLFSLKELSKLHYYGWNWWCTWGGTELLMSPNFNLRCSNRAWEIVHETDKMKWWLCWLSVSGNHCSLKVTTTPVGLDWFHLNPGNVILNLHYICIQNERLKREVWLWKRKMLCYSWLTSNNWTNKHTAVKVIIVISNGSKNSSEKGEEEALVVLAEIAVFARRQYFLGNVQNDKPYNYTC